MQSILVAGGHVLLKFGLQRMLPFSWSLDFFKSALFNWQFVACGIFYSLGSLLWFYIVKNFPFSMAYPLVSLTYVLGMLAAIVFFHESVDAMKWLGVAMIVCGCFFIAR